MQIDRGEESSPLHPGLFLARLTGDQQLASALHAETQHCVVSLPLQSLIFFLLKEQQNPDFFLLLSPFLLFSPPPRRSPFTVSSTFRRSVWSEGAIRLK